MKRILYFTNALNWTGGVNTMGEWVDENDELISDVAGLLNRNFSEANYGIGSESSSSNKYYIFTYKKWNKKASKAYTTVCPKIVPNDERNRKDLESYVQYMKANKFIVEHDDTNLVETEATTTSGSAVTFG